MEASFSKMVFVFFNNYFVKRPAFSSFKGFVDNLKTKSTSSPENCIPNILYSIAEGGSHWGNPIDFVNRIFMSRSNGQINQIYFNLTQSNNKVFCLFFNSWLHLILTKPHAQIASWNYPHTFLKLSILIIFFLILTHIFYN